MRKPFILGGSALLALSIPAIALAVGPMGMGKNSSMTRAEMETMVKERFALHDLNKDGTVTQEEMQKHRDQMHAERMDQRFKQMDSNNDGSISRAEFDSAHPARMGAGPGDGMGPHHGMKGMMGGGMGPGPMAGQMNDDCPMGQDGAGYHMKGHRMSGGMGGGMMAMSDTNKDGKVTLDEATKSALSHFDQVDTNKDKTISPEERKAWHDKMRAARKAQ